MKKVLIVGSRGMFGHVLKHMLSNHKIFRVIDISRLRDESSHTLDLFDLKKLDTILSTEAPDVVVNCAGILNDAAESNPATSIFINSFIPHYLAQRCKRLIHISTDCVFSGERGSYTESDLKDGKGYYAESKSLGEVLYRPHLTIRTSIIGPELKADGKGLLHWFLRQKDTIKGYSNAFWSGVSTLQLAKGVIELMDNPEITGLVHYTNNNKISKLNLLQLISSVYQSDITIIPFQEYYVDKSLVNTRTDIQLEIPEYEKMIQELYSFMEEHKVTFYQQYYS